MALNFPINPTIGDTYQTGSSATYKYTSQSYWEVTKPTTLATLNSKLFNGSTVNDFITTSSLGLTQTISGSLVISQSLIVLGNTTTTTITASNLDIGTNIVSVFASSPTILTGGYKVVDSSSLSTSSSLLYNVSQSRWTIDKPLSGSFSGSLFGTSSYALTASWLPLKAGTGITINQVSGSYFISSSTSGSGTGAGFPYSGSAIITGSLLVSGSTTITGSLNITGSTTISGSVNITGSLLLNGTPVGSATVLVSGSAPSGSATSGSLWWNNEDGNLYIQSSIRSGSSWVPAVTTVAGGNYGATYRNTYSASVWTVNHNLGETSPIIQVYSGSQVMIPASIVSQDAATTIITFASVVSGSVVASTGVGGITTSSFALTTPQATSASYALSSSFAESSSRTLSASFASTSITASFATTSSFLNGSQATYLSTTKNTTQQSIGASYTRVTNWDTATTSINATEWNPTTGIFTTTKTGIYSVTAQVQFSQAVYNIHDTVAVQIWKNGTAISTGFAIAPISASIFPASPVTTAIISLAVGDTMSVFAYSQRTNNTFTFANNLTIQELPSRIQR